MADQKGIRTTGPITSGQLEANVLHDVRLEVSKSGGTVFRNNVGKLKDQQGRLVSFGLCEGSSDLIGFYPVTITPDMIGRTIAVFLAIECKSSTGKASDSQNNFVRVVKESGGISGIARSAKEAKGIIDGF